MVLGLALSRAQRHAEAVEVLDRASSSLGSRHSEFALRLEAAAVVPGLNDLTRHLRRPYALRRYANGPPTIPPRHLSCWPWPRGPPSSRTSPLRPARARDPGASGRSERTLRLGGQAVVAEPTFCTGNACAVLRRAVCADASLLDASIAQAQATGRPGRLAVCLAIRGWLALRQGDLRAAEANTQMACRRRARHHPVPRHERRCATEALVEQGEARRRAGARATRLGSRQWNGHGCTSSPSPRAGGSARDASPKGSGTSSALGKPDACDGDLSELRPLAIGRRARPSRARRSRIGGTLGRELLLAQAFGAPRALGVALRAAGVVAGGDRGASCSVRPSTRSSAATPSWKGPAPVLISAPCFGDATGALKRENYARHSTPPTARAPDRSPNTPRPRLRATGARPRRVVLTGPDSLTASERRIAELASQGLTNREIAQTLFVTARTVEGHLTSIFLQATARLAKRASRCASG